MVLAGRDRGHGARVLAAVGAGRRSLARAGVGDVVRRREAEHRLELRAPLGRTTAGRGSRRSASARTGRGASRRSPSSRDEVTQLAEALVRLGVREGDRVAIFLPMSPEVAVASHACAHIGAIQVPIFSGFAAPAVAQRLQASEAKVVITAHTTRAGAGARCRCSRSSKRRAAKPRASSTSSSRRGTSSSPIRRESCRPPSSTRRRRTCSPTRQERPGRRRASSTCRAASSSRSRARSATRPTRARTTGSISSPTWAGSWGRGPSSAATRWARRSSSPKARPTGRRTGSGS